MKTLDFMYESKMLTEHKSYLLWESAGRKLVERELTDKEIEEIFKQAQTQSGRTLLGKGVDTAGAVNKAWEDLKSKIQNSGPVEGFDKKVSDILGKIGMGSADPKFQGQVSGWVQKYRDFAKKHPIAQGAIYATLIGLAGISGAGVGGAAALGLLKAADQLIQGQRFSSAAYSGAKTGAMAYAASHLAQYFKKPDTPLPPKTEVTLPSGQEYVVQKGDTLSAIAKKYGVSVDDLMKANSGQTTVTDISNQGWNNPYRSAFTDVNPMGDYTGPSPTEYSVDVAPKIANPDRLSIGQNLRIPAPTGADVYQGGVGTAADTWNKVQSGAYPYDQISANQAAKYGIDTGGLGQAASTATQAAQSGTSGINMNLYNQLKNAYIQKFATDPSNPSASVVQAAKMYAIDAAKKAVTKESKQLSESQIKLVFSKIALQQQKLITEGFWDTVKQKASDIGSRLTNKVTTNQLMKAWQAAGSPTDSNALIKIMTDNGVSLDVIKSIYGSMNIPMEPSMDQQQGQQPAAAPAGTSAAQAKPAAGGQSFAQGPTGYASTTMKTPTGSTVIPSIPKTPGGQSLPPGATGSTTTTGPSAAAASAPAKSGKVRDPVTGRFLKGAGATPATSPTTTEPSASAAPTQPATAAGAAPSSPSAAPATPATQAATSTSGTNLTYAQIIQAIQKLSDADKKKLGNAVKKNLDKLSVTQEGQIYFQGGGGPQSQHYYKPRHVPNQHQLIKKESAILRGYLL